MRSDTHSPPIGWQIVWTLWTMNHEQPETAWNFPILDTCVTLVCQFHPIIKVRSFGFGFLMLDLNDKSSMWISHTPRISDAIWGTPNPVESSKVWNLSRLLFICHPGPFMANLAFAHGLITEVNATDALHCQQICVVLLASLVVFKCVLLLF